MSEDLLAATEAIMTVADSPVSAQKLGLALEIDTARAQELLVNLAAIYEGGPDLPPRGMRLREAAGGWRMYSAPRYAAVVEKFVLEGASARLTQAALETLAIVAYRQPVTRGRISAIRGVNVDGVMRTLLTRGLIESVGTEGPGGANLYQTSTYFLEAMGLRDLGELEPLAPYLPELDDLDDLEDPR